MAPTQLSIPDTETDRHRSRTREIRAFLLDQAAANRQTISSLAAVRFGVSRLGINRHLRQLVADGLLEARGNTRARAYTLRVLDRFTHLLDVNEGLEEDRVWAEHIAPRVSGLRENVVSICRYGFTEMLNNVKDHSASPNATIMFYRTAVSVHLSVRDNGIGIFRKIAEALHLEDDEHAILELAKGKVTTDPEHHSGEGVFFSSRMFDSFGIASRSLHFSSQNADDWIFETQRREPLEGTMVLMEIRVNAQTTLAEVFRRFTADLKEHGFTKTTIPVHLLLHEGDHLVSRSQAKRLLARVDRFKEVVLDFAGVETVGQAFADEIFRVFARSHPDVHLTPIHVSDEVLSMIVRAQRTGEQMAQREALD